MNRVGPAGLGVIVAGALAVGSAVSLSGSGSRAPQAPPAFLEPGHCYRIAFTIQGAPNYKVLERLDNGWLRGEVDAGPASAQRLSIWINTAQIVTARETTCSQ